MQDPSTLEPSQQARKRDKSPPLSRRSLGLIFILLWTMSAVFFGLLLLSNAAPGMGLAVVFMLHLAALLAFLITLRKRWWLGFIIWIAMFALSLGAYSLTVPKALDESDTDYNFGALSDEDFDAELSKPGFFDIGYALTLDMTTAAGAQVTGPTTEPMQLTLTIDQSLSLAQPLISETDTTPQKIVLRDITLLSAPANGSLSAIETTQPRSEIAPLSSDGGLPEGTISQGTSNPTSSNPSSSNPTSLIPSTITYNIADQLDVLGDFYGTVSFQLRFDQVQGTQEADLKLQLQYTLEVHTADGAIYSRLVTTESLPQGFLAAPELRTYHTLGPVLEEGAEGTPLIKAP